MVGMPSGKGRDKISGLSYGRSYKFSRKRRSYARDNTLLTHNQGPV
jgi:hypothetical protein